MKNIVGLLVVFLVLFSCENSDNKVDIEKTNFKKRFIQNAKIGAVQTGSTYLPVYSHVYQMHSDNHLYLTITSSIRNTSISDSIYIYSADYFNTQGEKIREYLKNPIFVKPLETVEIIIEQVDKEGGSGANFVFDWGIKDKKNKPIFEAVMISTYGQQGVSFTTKGVEIYK